MSAKILRHSCLLSQRTSVTPGRERYWGLLRRQDFAQSLVGALEECLWLRLWGRRRSPYRSNCRDAWWGLHEGLIPETTRGLHVGWGSGDPMAAPGEDCGAGAGRVAQASGGDLRL